MNSFRPLPPFLLKTSPVTQQFGGFMDNRAGVVPVEKGRIVLPVPTAPRPL